MVSLEKKVPRVSEEERLRNMIKFGQGILENIRHGDAIVGNHMTDEDKEARFSALLTGHVAVVAGEIKLEELRDEQ